MRELKFRGLSVNGHWYYGLLSHTEDKKVCPDVGWFISNSVGCPFAYQIRPETIGQFTGLKDKNGREIYEGDIVKQKDFRPDMPKELISNIVFQEGCFVLDGWDEFICYNQCEVIGNIYENGDLLK